MRSRDRRCCDDDDVVLDQGLALDVSGRRESSDDRKLRPVRADELDDRLRRTDLDVELDTRMGRVECGDSVDSEVHPGT